MTTVNLAAIMQEAAKGGGGNVPPGIYDCVVESAKFGTSKGNKPQWAIVYRVVSPQQYAGGKIRDWETVSMESPRALGIMLEHFAILGIDAGFIQSNPGDLPGDMIAQMMLGKPVRLVLEQDGQYADIKRMESVPAGATPTQGQMPQQGFQPQMPQQAYQQPVQAPQQFQQQVYGQPQPQQPVPMQGGYPQQPAAQYQPEQAQQPVQPQGQVPGFPQQPVAGYGGQMESQQQAQQPGYPQQPQAPVQQEQPQQPVQQYQAPVAPPPQKPF